MEREELARLGEVLDHRPASLRGRTVGMELAMQWLRVRGRAGRSVRLRANTAQQEFERRRGTRNIVLKARQLGLTTWVAGRFFLRTITQPGTLTVQVAHTQEAAEEIFRIVRRFLEGLPAEVREGPLAGARASARQIVIPELDGQYRVVSAGDRNAGRGLTIQNLHCSELARWPNDPDETLAGLRAALVPGGELVIESTPEGVGGCFHEEWLRAGETGMVRHFFPWWMESRYRDEAAEEFSLTDEERELLVRAGLDREQIGFRRRLQREFRGLARQEYAEDAESCFLLSGDSIFTVESIETRLGEMTEAVERRRNGELEIWLPPMAGRRYVVAVDPAGGGAEGDYSAAQVLDWETGMQCAEFAGHVGGLDLARFVTGLAAEYNQALLAVERNNHGSGVLALIETVCRYGALYRQRGQLGWLTDAVSRPAMLGRLDAALVERPELFQSRRLLGECRSFVRRSDGSSGARSGLHDDRVMAMAIALAVRDEGARWAV